MTQCDLSSFHALQTALRMHAPGQQGNSTAAAVVQHKLLCHHYTTDTKCDLQAKNTFSEKTISAKDYIQKAMKTI